MQENGDLMMIRHEYIMCFEIGKRTGKIKLRILWMYVGWILIFVIYRSISFFKTDPRWTIRNLKHWNPSWLWEIFQVLPRWVDMAVLPTNGHTSTQTILTTALKILTIRSSRGANRLTYLVVQLNRWSCNIEVYPGRRQWIMDEFQWKFPHLPIEWRRKGNNNNSRRTTVITKVVEEGVGEVHGPNFVTSVVHHIPLLWPSFAQNAERSVFANSRRIVYQNKL